MDYWTETPKGERERERKGSFYFFLLLYNKMHIVFFIIFIFEHQMTIIRIMSRLRKKEKVRKCKGFFYGFLCTQLFLFFFEFFFFESLKNYL